MITLPRKSYVKLSYIRMLERSQRHQRRTMTRMKYSQSLIIDMILKMEHLNQTNLFRDRMNLDINPSHAE